MCNGGNKASWKPAGKPRASNRSAPDEQTRGDLPGATGGGRTGFEKSTVFPAAVGFEHMTNPI